MTPYPRGPSWPGKLPLLSCFWVPLWRCWVIDPKASCTHLRWHALCSSRFSNTHQPPVKTTTWVWKTMCLHEDRELQVFWSIYSTLETLVLNKTSLKLAFFSPHQAFSKHVYCKASLSVGHLRERLWLAIHVDGVWRALDVPQRRALLCRTLKGRQRPLIMRHFANL